MKISIFKNVKSVVGEYLKRRAYAQIPEPHVWVPYGKGNSIVIEIDEVLREFTDLSTVAIRENEAFAWSTRGEITLDSLDAIIEKLKKGVERAESFGYVNYGRWHESMSRYM